MHLLSQLELLSRLQLSFLQIVITSYSIHYTKLYEFAPPRMYEQMTRTVQVKYLDATWIKRKFYELSTKIGYHVADLKFQKKTIPWYWAVLKWLTYITVQKKIKDHLGLSRVRNAYTGGAAMGPDHFRFFHALGVNLKQIYGQTEVAGISVVHRSGDIKFDTVGHPRITSYNVCYTKLLRPPFFRL